MTTSELPATVPDIPGGPSDLEFFFDPGCPFAWQTSIWIRRVAALRDISVGWRFISLHHLNRDNDRPQAMKDAAWRSHQYLRVCAAARARLGNAAVSDLYRAHGE